MEKVIVVKVSLKRPVKNLTQVITDLIQRGGKPELHVESCEEAEQIQVTVEGGVIQHIGNIPEGIEVLVRDFDVDGTEDNLTLVEEEQCLESVWRKHPIDNSTMEDLHRQDRHDFPE